MPWYRLHVDCVVNTHEPHPEFLFTDLSSEDLQVLDVSFDGELSPGADVKARVTLALVADDEQAATARARDEVPHGSEVRDVRPGVPVTVDDPRKPPKAVIDALEYAHDMLGDMLGHDIDALRAGGRLQHTMAASVHLPAVFSRHYTPELLEQWARSVDAVAAKLLDYPDTYLTCTAEELAGHALIHVALDYFAVDEQLSAEQAEQARGKLAEMHDLAFEDHDILMLFNPAMDGIESDERFESAGFANLHVEDWFTPFRDDESAAAGT